MAGEFGLLVVHFKIYSEYQKLGLLSFNKYAITNVLRKEDQPAHRQRSGGRGQ